MDKMPLLDTERGSDGDMDQMDRNKPPNRMSMRRKLWQQKRKLKRGMTCDNILFKPPPEFTAVSRIGVYR